ncbi:MAG: hypothetical protein NZ954_07895 [Thermofilaceae archaeon]|nr:hypothetical protein [Thermofilaceae archaeon]MCX8179933.1 hypothetical protein [Thermofilaceae archaeon]MDW8004376.1 hypothetical protein [Thermofilaceae archaeon]
MYQLTLQVAVLLTIGYLLSRVWAKPVDTLNKFLFYITLPLSLTLSLAKIGNLSSFAASLALGLAHMLLTMLSSIALAHHLYSESKKELVTLSSLPNAIFIALPLATLLLGDSVYAIPHATVFNIILVLLLAYLGFSGSNSVRRTIALYTGALALGLLLNLTGAYRTARNLIDSTSNFTSTANTLSFIVVGASLSKLKVSRRILKGLVFVAAARYILSPALLALALASMEAFQISIEDGFVKGAILQSIMPPAVTCIVLGKALNMDEDLIATAIAVLSPVSVTLSLLIYGVGTMPGSFG